MTTSVLVHELRTELVVQPFADRILVLVTQMGKVGSLIQASIPSTSALGTCDPRERLPRPHPAIQLTPIFGSAPSAHMQTLYSLYATQIATLVWLTVGGEPRSVVVGIALKVELEEEEQQTFHAVMDTLRDMLQTLCA